MKKILFIITILILSSAVFGSAVDTLEIYVVDFIGEAAIESVLVLVDTTGTGLTFYDTLYTNSSGIAYLQLPITDTYSLRMSKSGYVRNNLYFFKHENTSRDTLFLSVQLTLTPNYASPSRIVLTDLVNTDTLISYPESLGVTLTRRSTGDTLYDGYSDSIGVFGFSPDSLTDGVAYKVYVKDIDSAYSSKTMGFTWDSGSKYKINPINMSSFTAASLNTITGHLQTMDGKPVENEVISVTFPSTSFSQTVGSSKTFFKTRPLIYRSDSNGDFEIKVPDVWINIVIQNFGYSEGFYCDGDTTLGSIGTY